MTKQNPDLASPQNCLCFNARKTARLLTRAYDEALAPEGVTATQFSLLALLDAAKELRMTDLAAHSETDRTTLTRNLNLLERDGLIYRRSGEDARVRIVRLTMTGRRKLGAASKLWREVQGDTIAAIGSQRAAAIISHAALVGSIFDSTD